MDYKLTHPNEEQTVEMLGLQDYKFLGWQVDTGNCEELKKCYEAGHMGHQGIENKKTKDMQHNIRGSNCTYWCTACKHWWKIDMSD
jgi:hypothetical protein